jgi:hydroxypyruvate reductase
VIQNKKQLSNAKTIPALRILEAGLNASKPEHFLSKFIGKERLNINGRFYGVSKYHKIHLVAFGKAADSMAKFVCSKLKIDSGIIVIPQDYKPVFLQRNLKIFRSGHPIPNKTSVAAAKSIIRLLRDAKKDDLVIFLVSGGASALVCLPAGISLEQKQAITDTLLRCGASIAEINALRKHLSQIKGGRLVEYLNCDAVSFVMSDVVGDDLSSIASGLTYCDKTTYSDCLKIIKKYGLRKRIPARVLRYLMLGAKGKISETPKKPKIPNVVVANNKYCLDVMKKTAINLGYKTNILAQLVGNTSSAAKKILQNFSFKKNSCTIFGGETTVIVKRRGKGGRNQELILEILSRLQQNVVVASLGTDGIDGNTKEAGAIFYSIPAKKDARRYLKNNNSNSFFKKHGGLIKTGPTHTNLLDIGLILQS